MQGMFQLLSSEGSKKSEQQYIHLHKYTYMIWYNVYVYLGCVCHMVNMKLYVFLFICIILERAGSNPYIYFPIRPAEISKYISIVLDSNEKQHPATSPRSSYLLSCSFFSFSLTCKASAKHGISSVCTQVARKIKNGWSSTLERNKYELWEGKMAVVKLRNRNVHQTPCLQLKAD